MLKFIGTGSAFKSNLGNNSAYIKENNSMLLFDCGGTVFHSLKNKGILDDLKYVYILITHTHLDHIGSLGDIIFYCHYILHIKPVICYPGQKVLENFLDIVGVSKIMYTLDNRRKIKIFDENLKEFEIVFNLGSHVPQLEAYNIILNIFDKKIYYSGDSNDLSKDIIERIKNNEITNIYQDTCGLDYEKNPHLSLKKLCSIIPEKEIRKKVYCMHLDDSLDIEEVLKEGFNIACNE